MKYVKTAYVITIENKVLKLCFSIIHTLSQDDMLSFEWWQWLHDSKLKIVHSTSVTNSKTLKVLEQKMSLKLHLRLELKEKHCIGRVCTLICTLCYIGLQFILVFWSTEISKCWIQRCPKNCTGVFGYHPCPTTHHLKSEGSHQTSCKLATKAVHSKTHYMTTILSRT